MLCSYVTENNQGCSIQKENWGKCFTELSALGIANSVSIYESWRLHRNINTILRQSFSYNSHLHVCSSLDRNRQSS